MIDDAGDLDLVHGEDHRRRRARPAQPVAHLHDLGDLGSLAAEVAGHRHAEQAVLARRSDGLGREARAGVDLVGVTGRDLGHGRRSRRGIRSQFGVRRSVRP